MRQTQTTHIEPVGGDSCSSNNNNNVETKEEDIQQRPKLPEVHGIPEEDAWLIPSQLLFSWMYPLFRKAQILHKNHMALEQEDLLPLPTIDKGSILTNKFELAWNEYYYNNNEKENNNVNNNNKKDDEENNNNNNNQRTDILRKTIFAVIGRRFVIAGIIKFFNSALQFTFPLLLNAILRFIEDTQAGKYDDSDPWYVQYRGYWLSVLLFTAMGCKAITENAYFLRVMRSGYQARVAISVAVYNKSLRLANSERQSTTLGELVNLMQVDATKIEMFIPQIHVLWDGLLQITGYMVILYTLIGWPCFAGLGVMIAAGPIQGHIMKKLFGLNRQMVKYTDGRVRTTNEALQGMQSVKMFAWEDNFGKMINVNRDQELYFLRQVSYLRGFSRAYISALPGLVAVVSFVVYALGKINADISASTLFAALVAFDQLRFPLLFYPMTLAQLAQASVSAARVQNFLSMKETGHYNEDIGGNNGVYERTQNGPGEIIIEDATVYWSDPTIPIDDNNDTQHSKDFSESKSITTETDTENGELRYPKPVLKDINMHVKPGELFAVVGKVGCGKSTLCSTILNESLIQNGKITLHGKVAYASQSPWILNASLKDNILFGLPMDEVRYNNVIQACQLQHDIKMLENGDETEIGEKGINISGGQKQRVSVARAAYANADTIILDDPLSALDPEVGKKLFDECIVKLMAGKTRLLITNQLQYLKSCDSVLALRHGKVIEQGKFTDLIANENSEINRLLKENAARKSESTKQEKKTDDQLTDSTTVTKIEGKQDSSNDNNQKKTGAGALVTKEERAIGAVSLSVYKKYIIAGGGYMKFTLVYFAFILATANQLSYNAWVSYWTSDAASYERHSEAFYLGMYAMLSITLGLVTFIRTFYLVRFGVSASESLHRNLVLSVLRAPQSFFDTTPIGRILSRFSKDLYSVDIELADTVDFFISCSLSVVTSIGTILFTTPWFAIAVVPLGFFYFRILNYFREVSRETKRLESISRSPVYAQFSETLGGLPTIRAYGESKRFIDSFEERVDENTRAYYNNKGADRWLSTRLELIGATIAGLAAAFAVQVAISGSVSGQGSDSNFASLAGLSLTQAISVTGLLNWCVRTFAQMEAAMNACERVLYYTEEIDQEAPWTSEDLEREYASNPQEPPSKSNPSMYALAVNNGKAVHVSKEWPNQGAIVLKNLRMRYRTDTPLVLKGLNVTISGGERVGVVGRTGSGKSSLMLSLLRLVEPSLAGDDMQNYESPIEIDGVDTLRIGLRELRSRLGIIPQNPVLFSGAIRSNVDPFDQYTDEQLWSALDKCGMKESVEEMPGQLGASVSEYGENLSAGMRQMLVLGRALLRQCKVLLLDEATSNVDLETDQAIQKTIREAFPGCTVLTIAHRINTILDSDKILVMKDGYVEEFASPQELLADEKSTFSDIVRHSEASHD